MTAQPSERAIIAGYDSLPKPPMRASLEWYRQAVMVTLSEMAKAEPQGLNAATVARAFEVMLPAHDGVLILKHNPHLSTDMHAYMRYTGRLLEFVTDDEHEKIKTSNELWVLHYTPKDGCHLRLAAATLPAIAQWLEDNGLAFGS